MNALDIPCILCVLSIRVFPLFFFFLNRKLDSENFSVTFSITSISFSHFVNESLTLPQNHSINDGDLSEEVTRGNDTETFVCGLKKG